MLSLARGLLFPSLRRFGETSFKSWQDEQKTTDLYTLYWDDVDNFKKESFSKHQLTSSSIFPGTLPKEYDNLTKSFVFALPRTYIDEIRSQSRTAQTEWSHKYPFDTDIRETCLTSAVSHVYVSFALLKDCLYDPTINYFSRSSVKTIAAQLMLYKFWTFQTGRARVECHAQFDKLRTKLEYLKPGENDETSSEIVKFLEVIKQYEEHLNTLYKPILVESCNSSNYLKLSSKDVTVTLGSAAQPALIVDGDVEIKGKLVEGTTPESVRSVQTKEHIDEEFIAWVQDQSGGVLLEHKENDLPVIMLPNAKVCSLPSDKIMFLNQNKWFKSKQDITYPMINKLNPIILAKALNAQKNSTVVLIRHRNSVDYAIIKSVQSSGK